MAGPGWHGSLKIDYRRDGERTVAHTHHTGPLRVLASLYPEAPSVCHHVLVHPPGGIVGGDVLDIHLSFAEGAHAVLTTPGATRFYRSAGPTAAQTLEAQLAPGARLEWLPLENIAYDATQAVNHLRFALQPGAEMMGWDVMALGLPASGQAFARGRFEQSIELPGTWLERGILDTADPATQRLLDSPLGWAGRRVLATMWFAAGTALPPQRIQGLLDAARACLQGDALASYAGATSPDTKLVVVRALAERTEPAFALLGRVWAAWRQAAWALPACVPRVWRT